jgi:hypothetical protein
LEALSVIDANEFEIVLFIISEVLMFLGGFLIGWGLNG